MNIVHRAARRLALAVAVLAFAGGAARADFINGGFEQGDFYDVPGWEGLGDFGSQPGNLDGLEIYPTEGSRYGYVSTTFDFGAAPADIVEEFLGLPAGFFASFGIDVTTGSALKQSVTLAAGDLVTFDFNFASFDTFGDPNFNDIGILVTLSDSSGNGSVFVLADLLSATLPAGPGLQTGWISAALPVENINLFVPGDYTIGFAAFNVGDDLFDSYLFIDNVQLSAIPEPASLIGLSFGLVAGLTYWRRKRA